MANKSGKEIERKFLVNQISFSLEGSESKRILQGYFEGDDGQNYRVRLYGDKYIKTWKSDGDLVREEIENEISEDEFNSLWEKTTGMQLEKTRYFIPFENRTIEFDVFEGKLKGLLLAEVEFNSVEDAENFNPPNWFGKDVTSDKRYRNSALAKNGIPK